MTAAETAKSLEIWIADWLSSELRMPPVDIAKDKTFVRYGMDSVLAMMLVGDLEDRLKRRLPPTLTWDYPTIEALAGFLATAPTSPVRTVSRTEEVDLLSRLDEMSEEEIDRLLEKRKEPAALSQV